jgi:superfamily I DNA/RNA helicase
VSTFLLARTNRQARALGSVLRSEGVPYTELGSSWDVWNARLTKLHSTLRDLRAGENVPGAGVRELFDALADSERESRERAMFGGKPMWSKVSPTDLFANADVRDAFPEDVEDVARYYLTSLRPMRRDALVAALGAGAENSPTDVQIGTVHASKGLEARSVLLFGGYTSKLEERYHLDDELAAEEHRLYYVGATRCSEALYVVTDYFKGATFPGFRGHVPVSNPPGVEA